MKKYFLSSLLISGLACGVEANAQINSGGTPLSLLETKVNTAKNTIYQVEKSWAETKAEYDQQGPNQPVLIAQKANTNISFPESGTFTYLDNGDMIWQAQITIPNSPAIGLYFDQYKLVKGTTLYVKSANELQILGGFNESNNSEDLLFAIEPTLGDKATIELNIKAGTDLNDIKFHIDKAMVYHAGIEHLKNYLSNDELKLITGTDPDPYGLEGRSSSCMINAACSVGESHPLSRRAAVQTIIPVGAGLGMCSATVMNSTSNSPENCKPLLFLASHCESSGSGVTSSHFSQWQIRFNFEKDQCNGGAPAKQSTMTGAYFKSRSEFLPQWINDPTPMVADFLLLEFKSTIPSNYNAVIAGWDINTMPQQLSGNDKYIAFHHPSGDVKKILQTKIAAHDGTRAYQVQLQNRTTDGGAAQGSSGSGLFKDDGYTIATASTAGYGFNPDNVCIANDKQFMNIVNYYRISHGWEWTSNSNAQLKAHLDPNNTGVTRLNPVTTECKAINTSVTKINSLEGNINVYPNPSTDGKLNIAFNIEDPTNLQVELFDLTGKRLIYQQLKNVSNNTVTLDVDQLNSGLYMIKISNNNSIFSKKISIIK